MTTAVVHILANGDIDYLSDDASLTFLVIDERAPNDRVYRLTVHSERAAEIPALIGGSYIHQLGDKPVTEAKISAVLHGTEWPRPKISVAIDNTHRPKSGDQ